MTDLTVDQLDVLEEVRKLNDHGSDYSPGYGVGKKTLKSLEDRGLLTRVDIGQFRITTGGRKVLEDSEKTSGESNLGDFV